MVWAWIDCETKTKLHFSLRVYRPHVFLFVGDCFRSQSSSRRDDRAHAMFGMFHNEQWHTFAIAWNKVCGLFTYIYKWDILRCSKLLSLLGRQIIDELRVGDLLSNAERDMMRFRFLAVGLNVEASPATAMGTQLIVPSVVFFLLLYVCIGEHDFNLYLGILVVVQHFL